MKDSEPDRPSSSRGAGSVDDNTGHNPFASGAAALDAATVASLRRPNAPTSSMGKQAAITGDDLPSCAARHKQRWRDHRDRCGRDPRCPCWSDGVALQ
jgi:hypothetical protein